MDIQLKNVKYAAFNSQETDCYSASLWINGKRIGNVSNEGHGGCDMFEGDQKAYQEADQWCKTNLPKWSLDKDDPVEFDTSLEMRCSELLSTHLALKKLKNHLRAKFLFTNTGEAGVFSIPKGKNPDGTKKMLLAKYPGAQLLNDMCPDKALTLLNASD